MKVSKSYLSLSRQSRGRRMLLVMAIVASEVVLCYIAILALRSSFAAGPVVAYEAELASPSGIAKVVDDSNASGGKAVQFPAPAAPTPTPSPTPSPTPTPTPTPTPSPSPTGYNAAVLADNPVGFWPMTGGSTEADLVGGHNGSYINGAPAAATLPNGDRANDFNGTSQYLSIPSFGALSISNSPSHALTWEAWMRPDVTDNFPRRSADGYVNWMGKCFNFHPGCEWEGRFYQISGTDRCNRLSAYIFNADAGLGSGAYWQAATCGAVQAGKWLHIVGEYQTTTQVAGCSGPGGINIWVNGVPWNKGAHGDTGCLSQYGINPTATNSPFTVGSTQPNESFLRGAVGKVAVYNYLLSQARINVHYQAMTGKSPSGSCGGTCSSPAYY